METNSNSESEAEIVDPKTLDNLPEPVFPDAPTSAPDKFASKKRNEHKYSTYAYYSSDSDVEFDNSNPRKHLRRSGLRRQAFPVPRHIVSNFDTSREPTNAAEYLAIVREEARQMPKIMSKKVDSAKLKKQTRSIKKEFTVNFSIDNAHAVANTCNNNSTSSGASQRGPDPILPTKEWRVQIAEKFAKQRRLVQRLSKHNIGTQMNPSIRSVKMFECPGSLENLGTQQIQNSEQIQSTHVVLPRAGEVSHWLHFMLGILPLHPWSKYKGSEQSKRIRYPVPPLLTILAQMEPVDTEAVLKVLIRYIMSSHDLRERHVQKVQKVQKEKNESKMEVDGAEAETNGCDGVNNESDGFAPSELDALPVSEDDDEEQDTSEEAIDSKIEDAQHGKDLQEVQEVQEVQDVQDVEMNENEQQRERSSNSSLCLDKSGLCKDKSQKSETNEKKICDEEDVDMKNEQKKKIKKVTREMGLTYLSGMWMYALMSRLSDPMSPEIIAEIRDFARFCIRIRSDVLKMHGSGQDAVADQETEKYLKLVPLINTFVVVVEDVFDQKYL